MKNKYLYLGLMAALAFSCAEEELVDPNEGMVLTTDETFYACMEARSDEDSTRTYVDAENSHYLRWNKDDRITVFNRKTAGLEYSFLGEEGSSSGAFAKIAGQAAPTGEPLNGDCDYAYAIYPHSKETTIQTDGIICFNLPAIQRHKKNDSFGKDANVMVAKTRDNTLIFKNAGGYLTLRLYRGGNRSISVSSITL